jgi:hypothetical protein
MYNVTVERNGNTYNYKCDECGWKDSTTVVLTFSKSKNHSMRMSLYRNDSIEVKEIEEKVKGG